MTDEVTDQLLAAIDSQPDLSNDKKKEIKDWIRNSKKRLEILITGRTGVGKSKLVNSLIGKEVAKVGNKLDIQTKNVEAHEVKTKEGVEVVVWDSPGLQDGSGNEEEYLAELKEKCSNVDIVIYCIDIAATRSELACEEEEVQNDLSAIQKLTTKFGTDWWKHSFFVLTRANALVATLSVEGDLEKRFNERLQDWKERIHGALIAAGVSKEITDKVPVEPAGYPSKPHLPGRKYWLSALWFTFIRYAKEESQLAITKVNLDRLAKESDVKQEDFKKPGHEQPIVTDHNWVVPTAIGVGGVVGGVAGGLAVGSKLGATLGLAAGPVGAVAGAVLGGVIGLGAGLLTKLFFRK